KQKKLIMLPSETMIWQPEFTDKTLSRKPGAVQERYLSFCFYRERAHGVLSVMQTKTSEPFILFAQFASSC
ncbi:hypothetical protein, partial [Escherichia fergusonii]|uniref:hypothetical protein n=1 Tax=Escherichia fergusonii TaxID=564 RepID=UPI001CBF65ED